MKKDNRKKQAEQNVNTSSARPTAVRKYCMSLLGRTTDPYQLCAQ